MMRNVNSLKLKTFVKEIEELEAVNLTARQ
jgi:hypothetical protein